MMPGSSIKAFTSAKASEMTAQMMCNGAGGLNSASANFSAQNLIGFGDNIDGQNKIDSVAPMKLNFSNEALGDSAEYQEALGDQSASMAVENLLHDANAASTLQEFPSLRDLETSNLLTNRFMGDKAA